MEHFAEQAWADFARGLTVPEKTQSIRAHLAAECLRCKSDAKFWNRVQVWAKEELDYSAPEDLVRLAKLEFEARHGIQAEKWTLASLFFDSAMQPQMAGVRSGVSLARQVVFEAEGLTVDLRFDVMVPTGKICAVGQILDRQGPLYQMAGAPIVLWTEKGQLIATTTANTYGEFQLEFEVRDDLRLTARVGGRRVKMPLTNLK